MYSDFLLRCCVLVVFAASMLDSATAKERKCVYMFNTCVSCEAPLTCENSRPVGSKSSSATARRPKPSRLSSAPTQPERKISTTTTRSASTTATEPSPAKTAPPQLRATTGFDREYKQFEAFMKSRRVNGRHPDARELQEMYFTYRLWLSRQVGGPSDPTLN